MASAVVHLRHGMAMTICRYRAQRGRDTSRRCLSLDMPHQGMTECGFYVDGNGFVVSAVFFIGSLCLSKCLHVNAKEYLFLDNVPLRLQLVSIYDKASMSMKWSPWSLHTQHLWSSCILKCFHQCKKTPPRGPTYVMHVAHREVLVSALDS